MKIFSLVSENIVMAAGGPMGSPVVNNFTKPFSTLTKAKKFAQKDYNGDEKITWSKRGKYHCSGDLRYVMYTITEVSVA